MKNLIFSKRFRVLLLFQSLFALFLHGGTLPLIIIQTEKDSITDTYKTILDAPRIVANMKIIEYPGDLHDYSAIPSDSHHLHYDGKITIEIRGSSSKILPKKQYAITTKQADGTTNRNVGLLGMPAENDWVLNGLAFDSSLIRDYLCYRLYEKMGHYSPRTVYCEVVINKDYKGIYLLQESIKADAHRINISKNKKRKDHQDSGACGYIIKADKSTGGDVAAWTLPSYPDSFPVEFIHEYPKPKNITAEQNLFIKNSFLKLVMTARAHHRSVTDGYPSVIDIPSFTDYLLMNEFSANADAYLYSSYFHKDSGGKLKAGPIWDHNLTFGNDNFQWGFYRSKSEGWQCSPKYNQRPSFWKNLLDDTLFHCCLSKRWKQLTAPGNPFNYHYLNAFIDSTIGHIQAAAMREQARWKTAPDIRKEAEEIKHFIQQRTAWLSNQFSGGTGCESTPVSLVISKINYHPKGISPTLPSDSLEFIEITNTGNDTVPLAGIHFSGSGFQYQFPAHAMLKPKQQAFIASSGKGFYARYGLLPMGAFYRNLSNSGQTIVLSDAWGNEIDRVTYSSQPPWPDVSRNGYYLSLIQTKADNALPVHWEALPERQLKIPLPSKTK